MYMVLDGLRRLVQGPYCRNGSRSTSFLSWPPYWPFLELTCLSQSFDICLLEEHAVEDSIFVLGNV